MIRPMFTESPHRRQKTIKKDKLVQELLLALHGLGGDECVAGSLIDLVLVIRAVHHAIKSSTSSMVNSSPIASSMVRMP